MKNFIYKTIAIVAFFLGTGFLSVASAQTAGSMFNNMSNDLATVRVSNVTQNPGSTMNWSSSVNANPNDVIAVTIYYHNTSSVSASNMTLHMSPKVSGTVNSQSFTGDIWASNLAANCTRCTGQAQVYINGSQAQTLTFIPGSLRWYPDAPVSTTTNTFSSAQENALFSSTGLNLGTIAAHGSSGGCPSYQSFCHQGSIVAQFRVSNNTPAPACSASLTASSTSVAYNGSATLNWSTTGAQSVSISGIGSNLALVGSHVVSNLQSNQSYTMTVNCKDGSTRQQTVYITVGQAPACTATFNASDTYLTAGESAVLTWTTNNASSVSISPFSSDINFGKNGNVTVSPTSTTTYTLTVNCNNGNTIVKTVKITVTTPVAPTVANCVVNSFSASPSIVAYGSPSRLYWTTTNCNQVSITNLGSQMLSSSTTTGNLIMDTTYTLSASGANGSTDTKVVTVYVTQQPVQGYCAITSFNAAQSLIANGATTTLTWSTTNDCTDVSISSIGTVGTAGQRITAPIYGTTTFTLSASKLGGAVQTQSLVINTYQTPAPPTPQSQVYACNDGIDNDGDGLVDMNDPGCLYPTYNSEYNYVTPTPTPSSISVSTLVASGVGQTSASLNGYISSVCQGGSTYLPAITQVYFQWGTTSALGATTSAQTLANGSFSAYIYNLAPDTTYYYRAFGQGCGGTDYGQILSFRTRSQVITDNGPVVIYTGGGSGSAPLMTLTIDSRYDTYRPGDAIDYVVTYKNIAKRTTLRDVVVHIQLPANVGDVRTTRGEYSLKDNTVTVEVGTLAPQEEQSFFIDGIVKTSARNGDPLVASGTAAYVYGNNIQDDVVAYSIDTVSGTLGFLAGLALFGANGILPHTLIGWLIFILIVLLIIMLGRRAFAPTRFVKQIPPTHLPH